MAFHHLSLEGGYRRHAKGWVDEEMPSTDGRESSTPPPLMDEEDTLARMDASGIDGMDG